MQDISEVYVVASDRGHELFSRFVASPVTLLKLIRILTRFELLSGIGAMKMTAFA